MTPHQAKPTSSFQRLVLKVGASVLTTAEGHFSLATVNRLADELAEFRLSGGQLLIVSSGAIACGMDTLKFSSRPKTLPELQACAAIGQGKLMKAYEDAFSRHGIHTAQILLTRDAFHDRLRYLNVRNTVHSLLEMGVIPIVNENDTVSTDEIRFGDNDLLSALMATLVHPDILVLLSDVTGLMNRSTGERIDRIISIKELDEIACAHVNDKNKKYSVGGMQAKLDAVRVALQSGVTVILANGKTVGLFSGLIRGENVGTIFVPKKGKMKLHKQWLAHNAKVKGGIFVDDGARKAIVEGGKSLLASGIRKVEGHFQPGSIVCIRDASGHEVARGLVNYSSEELSKVMGKKTSEIRTILKTNYFEEVIHRDNLAVLVEASS